uniref:Dendritic cell-specific transmembrane protein-like domain-containing protein n=1 Tax=Parascaris univalens TaxID=6257 RepID=A0A914ZVN5_PARUN
SIPSGRQTCLMSFLSLYRQRNKALAKLQKFVLIAENCRRSVAGEPLLTDKCELLYSVACFINSSRFSPYISLNFRNVCKASFKFYHLRCSAFVGTC